jgi:energy-coupling factor transporter ATP-binding protein EcfA2
MEPQSTYITCIKVQKLFGRYSYTIPSDDGRTVFPVSVLYGDNGCGKTTLLHLLFHLLSPNGRSGHRSYLAKTPFLEIYVELSCGTTVRAFRSQSRGGKFTLEAKHPSGDPWTLDLSTKEDSDVVQGDPKTVAKIQKFYEPLLGILPRVFLLSDDRVLTSDSLEPADAEIVETQVTMVEEVIERPGGERHRILRQRPIQLPDTLSISVRQFEREMARQAMASSDEGEASVFTSYEDLVRRIVSADVAEDEPTKSGVRDLIERLAGVKERSIEYERLGLAPRRHTEEIARLLSIAKPTTHGVLNTILHPFIEGTSSKLDALLPTLQRMQGFERLLNSYLRDKKVVIHARTGLSIHSSSGPLSVSALSSGERQLLMLFCNAYTAEPNATVFIIDEPEISLNVKWQRRLIKSLLELSSGSTVQYILATHSIELLSQYRDAVSKLNSL